MTHITYCRNLISSKCTASPVFDALWLVLPFREMTNFIRFGPKHLMFVCYLPIFSFTLYSFQNLSLMCFCRICILMYYGKKESVYLQNFTDYKPVLLTPSQNRCTCGNCQVLGRVEACIRCHEIEAVQNKNIEAVTSGECEEQPQCITQHPGFHPVCINRWVLQVAWYQYKQQYKAACDGREDKLFRHIAYRQLTRWCWGILGKEIRVVLPACAVMCIRNFYPPPGPEEDFVFEGFHYADE